MTTIGTARRIIAALDASDGDLPMWVNNHVMCTVDELRDLATSVANPPTVTFTEHGAHMTMHVDPPDAATAPASLEFMRDMVERFNEMRARLAEASTWRWSEGPATDPTTYSKEAVDRMKAAAGAVSESEQPHEQETTDG